MYRKVDSMINTIEKMVTMIALDILKSYVSINKRSILVPYTFPSCGPTIDDVKRIRRGLLTYIELELTRRRKKQQYYMLVPHIIILEDITLQGQ